jgi:hypothetical protein
MFITVFKRARYWILLSGQANEFHAVTSCVSLLTILILSFRLYLDIPSNFFLSWFQYRVLRRIFRSKRDEVMGEWRKLHKKELHDLYSSPSIIRIIKSRRMRWAGHVARRGTLIDYRWESQRERDH